MEEQKAEYPKFVVFGLMSYGPHVWTFETAQEVAEFFLGQYLPHFAVFKNQDLVCLKSAEYAEMQRQLED